MINRQKAQKRAARSDRLAAALRENLKRRKAQARSRAAGDSADDLPPDPADAATSKATPEPEDKARPGVPDFRRNPGSE